MQTGKASLVPLHRRFDGLPERFQTEAQLSLERPLWVETRHSAVRLPGNPHRTTCIQSSVLSRVAAARKAVIPHCLPGNRVFEGSERGGHPRCYPHGGSLGARSTGA